MFCTLTEQRTAHLSHKHWTQNGSTSVVFCKRFYKLFYESNVYLLFLGISHWKGSPQLCLDPVRTSWDWLVERTLHGDQLFWNWDDEGSQQKPCFHSLPWYWWFQQFHENGNSQLCHSYSIMLIFTFGDVSCTHAYTDDEHIQKNELHNTPAYASDAVRALAAALHSCFKTSAKSQNINCRGIELNWNVNFTGSTVIN